MCLLKKKKLKVADVHNYQLLGTLPWKRGKNGLNLHFPFQTLLLSIIKIACKCQYNYNNKKSY